MKDRDKTKGQRISELEEMRQRISELEALENKHKQVEVESRKAQERLHTILEYVSDGVAVTDMELRITDINKAGLRMFGYGNKEELIGRNGLELISPKDHARAMVDMRQTLEKGHSDTLEYMFLDKKGKKFLAEYTVAVIKGESGSPAGFVATMKDVSERKQAEEALRENEERFRIASQIASDVVYERDLQTGIATFYGDIDSHLGYEPGEDFICQVCPCLRLRKVTKIFTVG